MISENQREAIATQAYLLWVHEGHPHGRSLDHWLTAERQILSRGTPGEIRSKKNEKAAAPALKARKASAKKKK